MGDGVLLTKMVNIAVPKTIDEDLINLDNIGPQQIVYNLSNVLAACKTIGIDFGKYNDIIDVGKIFDYFDKNEDARISIDELTKLLEKLGVDISDKVKLDEIIASFDIDTKIT